MHDKYSIERFSEVLNVHHHYSKFPLSYIYPAVYTNEMPFFSMNSLLLDSLDCLEDDTKNQEMSFKQ